MTESTFDDEEVGAAIPRPLWVVGVLVAVLVHGVLWWIYYNPQPKVLWGDEQRYLDAAARLLEGDPAWRPGYLWPSLYARFVAGVAAVGAGSLVVVQLFQTALLALTGVIVGDLCRRLSGSYLSGTTAAWLCFAYPPLAAFAQYLWPEVLHLFLWMAALWIVVARSRSVGWLALAGASLGLALLTKSLLTPFLPVIVLAVLLPADGARRVSVAGLGRAAVLVSTLALVVAPTILSNRRAIGLPIISDSSAFNLWVGLNDRGRKAFTDEIVHGFYVEFMRSGSTFAERNRVLRGHIRDLFERRPLAEILVEQAGRQYFRLLDKHTYLTEQLPGGVAFREGRGYRAPPRVLAGSLRWSSHLGYITMLALAPLGFAVCSLRPRRWVAVLLLFVAYNLAIFFWLHVTARYRVQMLPVLFIGCGCAVAWLARGGRGERATTLRVLVGASTGGVLVFLALAGPFL